MAIDPNDPNWTIFTKRTHPPKLWWVFRVCRLAGLRVRRLNEIHRLFEPCILTQVHVDDEESAWEFLSLVDCMEDNDSVFTVRPTKRVAELCTAAYEAGAERPGKARDLFLQLLRDRVPGENPFLGGVSVVDHHKIEDLAAHYKRVLANLSEDDPHHVRGMHQDLGPR